ncbi:MAG: response regulator, partial [Bacteroidota bacterium]|nr:response regulator [Bacteroidota bacterium]
WETLQIIRGHADKVIRSMPVIFLTAEINQDNLQKIEQSGVSYLLPKPINPGKLIEAVNQLKSGSENAGYVEEKPNTGYLFSITDGNKNLMAELIDIFLEEAPLAIQKMKLSFEKNDFSALLRTIHKVKPNYKYVGMQKGEKLLNDLENDLENNRASETYLTRIHLLEQLTQNFIPHLNREKQLLQQTN